MFEFSKYLEDRSKAKGKAEGLAEGLAKGGKKFMEKVKAVKDKVRAGMPIDKAMDFFKIDDEDERSFCKEYCGNSAL